jgi:hypothetical protein
LPDDLSTILGPSPAQLKRNVFMYMISGAKVRAPAAAQALRIRLLCARHDPVGVAR